MKGPDGKEEGPGAKASLQEGPGGNQSGSRSEENENQGGGHQPKEGECPGWSILQPPVPVTTDTGPPSG